MKFIPHKPQRPKRKRIVVKRRTLSDSQRFLLKQCIVGLVVLIGISVMVMVVWYITRLPQLTLTVVEVVGGETVAHQEIRDVVERELEGTYFALVPKRFVWSYPESAIVSALQSVPRVKNVQVQTRSGGVVEVVFDEYIPHALWCELASDRCLLLDHRTYAFAHAPTMRGGGLVRYYTPSTTPQLGGTILGREARLQAERFTRTLEDQLSLYVVSITVPHEAELWYELARGGMLYTSLDQSVEHTLQNLLALWRSDEFSHLEPGSFQYIDLRYGDKVFVNEEIATTTPLVQASTTLMTE